jgi:hypothetical protein
MHPASDPDNATFAPLQLKGEIMDLEFTIDTDHRCASLVLLMKTQLNSVVSGNAGVTGRRSLA